MTRTLLVTLAAVPVLACGGAAAPPRERAPDVAPVATSAPDASAPVAPPSAPRRTQPELPSLALLTEAACTLHDPSATIDDLNPIVLRFHGKPFLRVSGPVSELDVRLAPGTKGGTASFATDRFVVQGETALSLWVRPRSPSLVDGWVDARVLRPTAVRAHGELQAKIELPRIVVPKKPLRDVFRCDELTLDVPPKAPHGERVHLKHSVNAPLSVTPNGTPVADLVIGKKPPLRPGTDIAPAGWQNDAIVLEKQGAFVMLRLGESGNSVVAWAPSSVVEDKFDSFSVGPGAPPKGAGTAVRCAHEVSVYVRDGDAVVRVGAVKPTQTILHGPIQASEAPLRWRRQFDHEEPELVPFVRAGDLEGCAADR